MAEFDLIADIASRVSGRRDVVLGIGDDAALLELPPGRQLVACCDTLNAGVHFFPDAAAEAIGWKALAVNLSDLAAMGATPLWALLSLSLPEPDADFVQGFMRGFQALAEKAGIVLVGGDTTQGPLSIGVTALGHVAVGEALLRSGARPGDEIWVSGTLGDAAAGLRLSEAALKTAHGRALRERLERPQPRLALGQALAGRATAAVDVSDGLLADLGHVAVASGVGMELHADALPASAALVAQISAELRLRHQATGGEDFELAFTLPPGTSHELLEDKDLQGLPLSRIGRVVAGQGVRLLDADDQEVRLEKAGWEHFSQARS